MNLSAPEFANLNRLLRHRIRNLAAGIRTATSLVAQDLAGRVPPEDQECFPLILAACDKLADLTNRLSLLTDPLPRGAARAAAEVVREAQTAAQAAVPTARFAFEAAAGAEAAAVADDACLRLALREVLTNAAQAAGPGGVTRVRQALEGDRLVLTVADQGPGVAPDVRARMFEPFFTTREQQLGVGLALARRVLGRLGGELEAGPGPGGGLAVRLALPRGAGGGPGLYGRLGNEEACE